MLTAAALVVSLASFQDPRPEEIAFETLLRDLVEWDWLCEAPAPGERCIQFSSYDRASEKGRSDPEAWYANNDCGVYLREEERDGRKEHVMAEAEGPGAVVRIWSANPSGTLRFYFDGETEPRYAVDFQRLCGGKEEPFLEPLCGVRARGWNCAIPFPFAKRLKITASTKDFYYQVNVQQFPKDTRVRSFEASDLGRLPAAASAMRARAAIPFAALARPAKGSMATSEGLDLAAGRSAVRALPAGPGVIRTLGIRLEKPATDAELRALRVRVRFDGETTVDAPLGDLFATAPALTPYATLPMRVIAPPAAATGTPATTGVGGGAECRFPMPYSESATIEIANEGSAASALTLSFGVEPLAKAPALRFHAKYRQAFALGTRPRSDYVVLDADGPGRFVGCALSVRNPVRDWWGEGDEHAFVDGEAFPSTFGTGTEDYFGYAWCDPTPFSAPFHAQSRCDGPGNRGYTSVNRFQIADAIPFAKHLRFELEVWHWAATEVDYATVAYWYAAPGAKDAMPPLPPAAARAPRPIPAVASKVPGAFEGEILAKAARATGGVVQVQDLSGFGKDWSRDEQLWWTSAKDGDRLEIPFETQESGRVRIRAQLTRAADYGIVRFTLDGAPLGGPFDGYHDGVVATGEIDLGAAEIAPGRHVLGAEIVGANPKAIPARMFGIDYWVLRRAP